MTSQPPLSPSKRLKIAYLCDFSPLDRNLYSGGNARIYDALQKHVGDVHILNTGWHLAEPLRKLTLALPERYSIRLRWRLHLLLACLIAPGVRREIAKGGYDLVFCAYSMQSLSCLRSPVPTVFTADATPMTYKQSRIGQSFDTFFSASRYLDPLILRAEKKVFQNTTLMLWPSDWLKSRADALYDLADDRSIVVPWGANIARPDAEKTAPTLDKNAPLNLLFVGRDWFAKGGPTTHETLVKLRAQGIDAHLNVIGCTPPDPFLTQGVTVHAELNKAKPDELALFLKTFRAAHFMVMPSMESWGFAFCEASAYGLPSLCLRVGGVPVCDGINGHAITPEQGSDQLCDIIQTYLDNPQAYAQLRKTSRAEYEAYLNWDAWGQTVASLVRETL